MEGPGCRIPIFLKGVNTDLTLLGNIGMEYLSHKIPFGRVIRKIPFNRQLTPKNPTLIRCPNRPFNIRLNISSITLINMHMNTYDNHDEGHVPEGPFVRHSWVCLVRINKILGFRLCWVRGGVPFWVAIWGER